MRTKLLLTFSLLCTFTALHAQPRADQVWLGGYQKNHDLGGVHGHRYHFMSSPTILTYQSMPYGFAGGCNTSIADQNGNLLFYTNGQAVVNRDMKLMPDGLGINDGEWARLFWPEKIYGYPGKQDILILPDPASATGYYLIHKTPVYDPIGYDSTEIRMSYIDMALDGGRGDLVFKNRYFYTRQDLLFSYLTAIRHQNRRDWWILQPAHGRAIKTFLLDTEGFKSMPDQDPQAFFTPRNSSSGGTAKFSPDGTKYAFYNIHDHLLIYDFDRTTGQLSFRESIVPVDTSGEYIFCSLEWSPSSRYIYTSTDVYLHQLDMWEPDPAKKVRLIDIYNGTKDPFSTDFYLMAQGPDCKIYMVPGSGSYSIHVINKPDEAGKACDFVQNGIKLPTAGGGLPNYPRFRVDETEKCNPGISSVFGHEVYYRRPLDVFPNPASDHVYIRGGLPVRAGTLVITDVYGRRLSELTIDNYQLPDHIELGHLPAGSYNIEIYPDHNPDRIYYGTQIVKL